MSQGNVRLGSAGLSGMIIRLVIQPAVATPTSTSADIHQCSWPSLPVTSRVESQLPSTVPTTVGDHGRQAEHAVGRRRFCSARSISGMLPSLAGPNSAACDPISATTRNIK